MKYMGSKNRIAKDILGIMLNNKGDRVWVEPFVGGGNMIDKVWGERIGSDSNKYAIDALISIRDNVNDLPKNNLEFTESDYKNLKISNFKYKGYASFAFSYSGKFMGGWCRNSGDKKRDYVKEAYDNAVKQSPKLNGVKLINCCYEQLEIPEKSLIYCDPPYQGTTKYKNNLFDYEKFWQWCRDKNSEGHIIFISEYNAPSDFICVYEKKIVSSLTKDTGSKIGIEKLFTLV